MVACHQLTPELAADVARASLVVLVDTAVDSGAPGSVSVRWIRLRPDRSPVWSHHLDPETLAGLAGTLYDAVPPMAVVSVAGASLAVGDRLSATLERALPEIVETVTRVVEEHRRL